MDNSTVTNDTMRQTSFPAHKALRAPRHRFLATLVLGGVLGLLAGCLYRMPIQQGNFLDPSQVVQLQAGMTRSQVKFLLGTPMVPSGFNSDRWDYYYYDLGLRMKKPTTKRVTVYFKDDKVERFDRPDDTEAAAAAMAGTTAATTPGP
jgi:outer membrane protein assembly factor BamE